MPTGLPATEIPAVAVKENDAFRPLTCQLVDGTSTSSIAVAEEPPRPEPMRADPRSRRRRQSFGCCFISLPTGAMSSKGMSGKD